MTKKKKVINKLVTLLDKLKKNLQKTLYDELKKNLQQTLHGKFHFNKIYIFCDGYIEGLLNHNIITKNQWKNLHLYLKDILKRRKLTDKIIVRYKVIRSRNRSSCLIHSRVGKYIRYYKKGSIIFAVKNSIGIFCSKTRKDAEQFIEDYFHHSDLKIIRVRAYGKGKKPTRICSDSFCFDAFYKSNYKIYSTNTITKGTICYKKVKVLE